MDPTHHYAATTCGLADDLTSTCSLAGTADVYYRVALKPNQCCTVQFDFASKMVISYGAGDPCGKYLGCGTFQGLVIDGNKPNNTPSWFAIESGTTPCGPYDFTVTPMACP